MTRAKMCKRWNTEFEGASAIGRRYCHDEIGTPFRVTVDFDTLNG